MSQLSLFDSQKPAPERRPPNQAFIRKHLVSLLRLARNAEIMPWNKADADYWERFFPRLTELMPPEEGEAFRVAFAAEIERLRKAA